MLLADSPGASGPNNAVVGSWTIRSRPKERGLEPDECYILGDPGARKRPDLAIEVEWTRGLVDKVEVYRGLVHRMQGRPVTVRTIDLGGDKLLAGMEGEENPFLGWRAIRYCLDRPEVFLAQLPDPLLDERHARFGKEAGNPAAGTGPEVGGRGSRREDGDIPSKKVFAFARDHSDQLRVLFHLDPEPIEELIAVQRIAKDIRMIALVEQPPVRPCGAQKDDDLVFAENFR